MSDGSKRATKKKVARRQTAAKRVAWNDPACKAIEKLEARTKELHEHIKLKRAFPSGKDWGR